MSGHNEVDESFVLKRDDEVSPERVAELLDISGSIVYQRMDSGTLSFRQVGTRRRNRADVVELEQSEEGEGPYGSLIRPRRKISKRIMPAPVKSAS